MAQEKIDSATDVWGKNDLGELYYQALFNEAKDAIFVYRPKASANEGRFIEVNDVACRSYEYTREEILRLSPFDLSSKEYVNGIPERIGKVLIDKHILFESVQVAKTNRKFPVEIASHLYEIDGEPVIISVVRDISQQKQVERDRQKALKLLRRSQKTLKKTNQKLARTNTAFEEVLQQVEAQKQNIKHDVIANIDKMLFPILMQIKLAGSDVVQEYVNLIEKSLTDLTSSFGRKITQTSIQLTAREVQICNLIRSGMASKEISRLLNISLNTVGRHRTSIRRKLGITNDKVNLGSLLQDM